MIPVTVLTGFLGSGKTTVLNRLLSRPDLSDTAVIINEFGDIGLDHLLVQSSQENLVLLTNGCLCCTVRGDLTQAFTQLAEIATYRRVVIETTGLADPAPILHTLMVDPAVTARHRLEGVITTVDAVNGAATLDAHQEAVKQAAVADRILLTKTDLSDALGLRQRLQSITSGTPIIEVRDGGIEPEAIFHVGLYDPSGKPADVRRWLHHADHHHHADHDPAVQAHCLSLDAPVRWSRFAYWLELLAAMRGENMLRVKGIVRIEEDPERPVVIHGVQHVFHPPIHLDAWPSDDHRTRLVFITRDMPRETLAATLEKFALAG